MRGVKERIPKRMTPAMSYVDDPRISRIFSRYSTFRGHKSLKKDWCEDCEGEATDPGEVQMVVTVGRDALFR